MMSNTKMRQNIVLAIVAVVLVVARLSCIRYEMMVGKADKPIVEPIAESGTIRVELGVYPYRFALQPRRMAVLELVKVEAGAFEMSVDKVENDSICEVPHHATITHDFYIGRTEVTQAQWKSVMGSNPSCDLEPDGPVECVSWHNAMDFCEKLNAMGKAPEGWRFSLPTETQWEFAARGGNRSRGFRFSGSDDPDEVAWYDTTGDFLDWHLHPVGGKTPNELGIYDMSGNVWEWCLDDWQKDSSKLEAEFVRGNDKDATERAKRGGCFTNHDLPCRVANRNSYPSGEENLDTGFRVALVPESYRNDLSASLQPSPSATP